MSEAIQEIMIQSEQHPGELVYRPITNDMEADLYLQEIRRAEEKKKEWKAFYSERQKSMEAELDENIENMKAMLEIYFGKVPHKQCQKQENYSLPSGKLVYKTRNEDFEYDEKAVIKWLKENNGQQFIKVKEELKWNDLKNTLLPMGELVTDVNGTIIPVIKVIEREPVFTVELKRK